MLARGLKSITKASSSIGKRIDMHKYVSDCLGITPGMRISNTKSDESIGITVLVVPRHSLENDLVVSLNLLKTESGLLKPKQLPCKARRRTSRLRARPAMSAPLRPRRERTGQRSAGLGPAVGQRRRWQQLLHGPGARRASCGGHTAAACESRELDQARCLGHEPRAETRGKAVLVSGRPAEACLPPELLLRPGAGARRASSLSLRNDRDCKGYHTNPRQSSFRTVFFHGE